MKSCVFISVLLGAALLLGGAAQAQAADTYENPAGHTPPGLEKQHKVPPGQAKKMDNDYRKGRKHQDGKRHDGDRDGRYDKNRRHDQRDGDRYHQRDRDGKRKDKRDGRDRERQRSTERQG